MYEIYVEWKLLGFKKLCDIKTLQMIYFYGQIIKWAEKSHCL